MSQQPLSAAGAAAPLPTAGYLLLAGITLFWGVNWPIMKVVLAEVPVWTFRSLCLLVGGIVLLALVGLGRGPLRVPTSDIRPLLVCSLFNIVGWHLFSGYGVSLMEAGRASIIAFTMPVWATILGRPLLGEAITRVKVLGLALGVTGLAVLIGPDLRGLGAAPLGALLMLGAAVSWALGTVLMKRHAWGIGSGLLAGWQLVAGGIPVTLGALLFEELPNPAALSGGTLLALGYVLIFPMAFCHWAWFQVVRIFPAAIAALGTLAIPVVGVLSGGLLLGEAVGPSEVTALVLVCAALVVVLVVPALRRAPG